ncbi:class I SAM-dependent methyltransferase [Candidatus Woesearchaeota archaeon]|nr:class I SAM-dependent methyltransferase [Candidatus Woesearchaeota archaeon]
MSRMWPDLVDFEARKRTEIPFILQQLAPYRDPVIFDACLGSGATTLGLKQVGIERIISNELDPGLRESALDEARKLGIQLDVTDYDWREIPDDLTSKVNVVVCSGNALTYLFKQSDQLKTLKNFRRILQPGGKLIIDERNYAEHFLRDNGASFRHSGTINYCGKNKVTVRPYYVSPTMVVLEYEHKERGVKAHLVLYPFKKNELKGLLQEVGFDEIDVFGDYKENVDPKEPEFITYICKK